MPFDGYDLPLSAYEPRPVPRPHPLIEELREVLGRNGERWIQGAMLDTRGRRCLVGALLYLAERGLPFEEVCAVRRVMCDLVRGPVERWNDSVRSFREIAAFLDRVERVLLDQEELRPAERVPEPFRVRAMGKPVRLPASLFMFNTKELA